MKATQSRILALLSLVQMSKFFSHFGVRALLILYMVKQLHYADAKSFGINAVFCGLVELCGVFGGIVADRYLGLKKAIFLGGWLLCIGYAGLILPGYFFLAMGVVIAGGSLFNSNISALLGLAYAAHDPNRHKGFTIFYMMQNAGAFLAMVMCSFIAIQYGFALAFIVAASGMLIGNLLLLIYQPLLNNLEKLPEKGFQWTRPVLILFSMTIIGAASIWSQQVVILCLPWITLGVLAFYGMKLLKNHTHTPHQIHALFVYLVALILFMAVEDQIMSSLILFADRMTSGTLFGWPVPSSLITSINPIVIVIFGALLAKRYVHLATPFLIASASFGILTFFCLAHIHFSILGVMGIIALISIAELMIGPLVMSYTSEVAHQGNPGMIMGMISISYSLAYQSSGLLSRLVAITDASTSFSVYGKGFALIACMMLCSGFLLSYLLRRTHVQHVSKTPKE